MDSIKIRILQLYPCNPAPQHRRGDCLARRLTSWPRTTRPLRPSAKLSSGPHSDAPSPASRTAREARTPLGTPIIFFCNCHCGRPHEPTFCSGCCFKELARAPRPEARASAFSIRFPSLSADPRHPSTRALLHRPRTLPLPSIASVGKVCCRGYASREERAECWDPRLRSGRPILPPQRIAAPAVGGCGSGGPSG